MSRSLFTDFLAQLGVPHTATYSDQQFAAMPFQSMFGLSHLLKTYGIDSEGYRIADKSELAALTPPFLADTVDGFVIVTGMAQGIVSYLSQGVAEQMPEADFAKAWNGVVLVAYPKPTSTEPDYRQHRLIELVDQSKLWVLGAVVAFLFVYVFVVNKIYAHWSTVALAVFDLAGLTLSFMLVQKTLKIKNKAADAVCGVLEAGGCDSILELKASSFFGIFKWSEVGLSYFSVSLLALLVFPGSMGALALCNLCCLPFTFWSIWYQKFRAKVWCTLCVSVQCTLWLLFGCYLLGGWYGSILPVGIDFVLLVCAYVAVLLGLNRFDNSTIYRNEADTQA